jgi:hypothetical protein
MADFKWLDNLTPERKEEELKKHIAQLRKKIKDAEQELRDSEELLTRAQEDVRVLENITVPEAQPISAEFVEVRTAPKQQGQPLEQMLDEAAVEQKRVEEISQLPMQQIYQSIKEIYSEQAAQGATYMQQKEEEKLYLLQRALDRKKDDIETGEYKPTDKAEHLMTAAEAMVKKMYKH